MVREVEGEQVQVRQFGESSPKGAGRILSQTVEKPAVGFRNDREGCVPTAWGLCEEA